MFLIVGVAIIAYLFYKWATVNYDFFEKKGIPFAKPVFLLGSSQHMFFNKMSMTDVVVKWYNELKHEKVSGMFEFRRPLYFIRDPKMAKKLSVKDFDHFVDHRVIIDEESDKMFGKSLISLKGQKWRDMRATLSPMFTGSKMRMMYDFVADVGKQTASTMKDQINAGSDNIFEFKALATKFTVDVIATCAFGIEVNSFKEPDNEFAKIANEATNFANFTTMMKFVGFLIIPPVMKFFKVNLFSKNISSFFQQAVTMNMKTREEQGIVRHDMINLLMQARKGKLTHESKEEKITEGFATVEESQMGKSQVKRVWDDDDLAAQAFIFFFAGFDTIATTMSFMAHEVMANQEVQQKLHEEIEAMEAELDGRSISYDQIQGLKYMDQVVCETLRKWPAAPMTDRICTKDYEMELDDGRKITIKKDQSYVIPIVGYHRDPQYFPDPMKFDPERFSDENKGNIDPDTYLPFGLGPRNCIGSRFALMELKTIFYYLLKNFSFDVTAKTQIPLLLDKNPIGMKTEKGVWVGLKPRA